MTLGGHRYRPIIPDHAGTHKQRSYFYFFIFSFELRKYRRNAMNGARGSEKNKRSQVIQYVNLPLETMSCKISGKLSTTG